MKQFNKATYNPEDNKLRIYCNIGEERVSDETYSLLREAGFNYAPIQKLFVAPSWSPKREDLCLDLVGNIIADDVTLVERAEAKAARLDDLSVKRAKEANGYLDAAHRMSQSLSDNQPVLAGHHSQRKALKAHDKLETLKEKWEEKSGAVDYWLYRAQGVERHANSKSSTKTRLNRIKTLLADLRSYQRRISEAHAALSIWEKIESLENSEIKEKKIRYFTGMKNLSPMGLWSKLDKNEITPDEAVTMSITHASNVANSIKNFRYIKHILNRLAYEHSELPWEIPLFEGDLTSAILQVFVRTHGGDSPKATKSDSGWLVVTKHPLPIHIGNGNALDLSADNWKTLMQSVGYEVPAPAPKKAPICNFKSFGVKVAKMYSNNGESELLRTIELTKAEYAEINSDSKMVKYSFCGKFRIKVCFDPHFEGHFFSAPKCVVFITDSKIHDVPDSDSVVLESLEVA